MIDTNFADDITFISNTIQRGKLSLQEVNGSTQQIDLHANDSKTECMVLRKPRRNLKSLKGKTLTNVDDFKYLGL